MSPFFNNTHIFRNWFEEIIFALHLMEGKYIFSYESQIVFYIDQNEIKVRAIKSNFQAGNFYTMLWIRALLI